MAAKQAMKENLQCTSKYGHLRISQDICHVGWQILRASLPYMGIVTICWIIMEIIKRSKLNGWLRDRNASCYHDMNLYLCVKNMIKCSIPVKSPTLSYSLLDEITSSASYYQNFIKYHTTFPRDLNMMTCIVVWILLSEDIALGEIFWPQAREDNVTTVTTF